MQEAAKRLGLTQAAVSQQLKALELEMGKELFQFHGKKKVANPLGKKTFEALSVELNRLESVWNALRSDELAPSQLTLTVAGRKEIVETVTDRIQFSGKIKFVSAPSQEAYEKLLQREADVAILTFKSKHARIVQKKLVSVSSRWFNVGKVSAADLASQKLYQLPIVAYSDKMPFLQEWCDHHKLDIRKLNVRAVIDNWYMVKSLALKHGALAIVPDNIDSYPEHDAYPVAPSIVRPVDFYYAYHEDSRTLLKRGNFSCQ